MPALQTRPGSQRRQDVADQNTANEHREYLGNLENLYASGVAIRNEGERLQDSQLICEWITEVRMWNDEVDRRVRQRWPAEAIFFRTLNRMRAIKLPGVTLGEHQLYLRTMEERIRRIEELIKRRFN